MSIMANRDTQVVIQGGPAGINAARRMGEFCHLIQAPLNIQAFVFPPDAGKTVEITCGVEPIAIPVYKTVAEATRNHPRTNTSLIYVGPDTAAGRPHEALAA